MRTRTGIVALVATLAIGSCFGADGKMTAKAVSPDGKNEIRLWMNPLAYEVARDGVVVVAKTEIGMTINGTDLKAERKPKVTSAKSKGVVATPVYKKAKVNLSGNESFVDFGDWGVRLAARADGVAYRFETKKPGTVKVNAEKGGITIPDAETTCSLNYGRQYGCEESVPLSCKAKEIETGKERNRQFVSVPFVYSIKGKYVAATDSDVCDYPVSYLHRAESEEGVCLESEFPHWPSKTRFAGGPEGTRGRWVPVVDYSDYLVETEGTRTYPWRAFVLADRPIDFCAADLVFALARKQAPGDFSWVKPGKVAWDWWNGWDNKGEKNGCTTAGYKRFIDFAALSGVEYVILDEGWSETLNIWKFHKNVDVPEIIRYGKEKGVGIILWIAWAQAFEDEARVAKHFAKLGAKGFKVDFMDRGDAEAERFLWRFAEECAKNKMLVDYHGSHRPTGMSRTYPNVINYEGVHGLEQAKGYRNGSYDFPDNDVKVFFLRMTAGPMDYTPGAMDNYPIGQYRGGGNNPGSVGTRCRQMAMMAAYEAPLQMLCDAPTKYEKNLESFTFMAETPVVWADTIGLDGTPDTFAAVARRAKDGAWYVAALNNATARDYTLDTARFLKKGLWRTEIFRDAKDADTNPTHYEHEVKVIKAGEKLNLPMAPGGGFVIRFSRQESVLRSVTPQTTNNPGKDWLPRHQKMMKEVRAGGAPVVFVGDSITHFWEWGGKSVWDKYFGKGPRRALNLGIAGDRTEHVLWRLTHGELDGFEAKVVVLMIGTNNTGHFPIEKEKPEDTIAGVKEILKVIHRKQPKAKIILCAIFPRGATAEDGARKRNDIVNKGLNELADRSSLITWFDIAPKYLKPDGTLPKELVHDLLHPSTAGYEVWAEALLPHLDKALGLKR